MKIGYTINIGDYQSIRVETSDLPTIDMCHQELKQMLNVHSHIEAVQNFMNEVGLE